MLFESYQKMPSGVKRIIKQSYSLLPQRLRLGRKFFREADFLEKTQWWSPKELKDYQNKQLQSLIQHAITNVPYYRNLFSQLSLTADDIKTVADLEKLPILTKDIIRDNYQQLRAQNFPDSKVINCSTSGTTGKPLKFHYDKSKDYLNFDPFIWRFFGWGGHTLKTVGVKLADWTIEKNKIYSFNPIRKLLILSAYNITQEKAEQYAQALKKYKAKHIDCYPSSMVLLTEYLKMAGIAPPVKLQAIFSHSEVLHTWQREILEDYWGCKCFDWYGMEERVILGVECEHHNGLHLCSDFSITEFIPDEKTVGDKIISTSLTNYAMPFLRYDTGDVGQLIEQPCTCNRGFPLFKLFGGRDKSFAVAKDGSKIPVGNIDIPSASENVLQFQFMQERPGILNLTIVKKPGFSQSDITNIYANLAEKFHDNMDIELHFSESIHKTSNSKTPIFVQKIRDK